MILIDDRQTSIEVTKELQKTIHELIDFTLKEEKVEHNYEVSIIFVNNEDIKNINEEQRGISSITDVLSFPMLEYPEHQVYKDIYVNYEFNHSYFDEGNLVLGDMALCLERAMEQSEEFGHSFKREVCYLIIHSILHLLGYDHIEQGDKEIMRKREEEILSSFNIVRC